jgi:DNA ligase-1
MLFPELYKIDSKGKIRVWYMELDEHSYRTIAGLKDGKLVTSAWTVATPKNVGRANATTASEQAKLEVEAEYVYQQFQGGYSTSLDNMGTKFFEPMLAKKYEDFVKKPTWPVYSQPKLDGVRCIVKADGMFSREGKPFVSCPHIFEALKPFLEANPTLIFDGELYNHKLRDDFNKIISLVKKQKPTAEELAESANIVQYHVYDTFDSANPGLSFKDRFIKNYDFYGGCIKPVITVICYNQIELDSEYQENIISGYEGQMLRIEGPYEQKRSKYLLKRKEFQDEEFEVVSISEGLGNWAGYAKSVRCRKKDGTEFDSGIKGSQEFTKELLTKSPKLVTIRYQNLTPDGIPRFPVAVAFYDEKRDM